MSRSEFWTLPPGEVWWLIDAHIPQTIQPQEQNERLLQLLEAAIEEAER
ncbi:MAG: hypothetical protein IE919_10010 [Thioclava sp.]|nr:hypothetical protein [Thioclava sp.]MBD3803558.1 hypothetical protein [Thioclava sp.]